MGRYFEEMRAVLERHGGTVEKFIGDAVMAVFGIPVVHEDDALRAVRAAAEMREALGPLNDELERERGVRIQVRVGVNTGEVVAGDSARRAEVRDRRCGQRRRAARASGAAGRDPDRREHLPPRAGRRHGRVHQASCPSRGNARAVSAVRLLAVPGGDRRPARIADRRTRRTSSSFSIGRSTESYASTRAGWSPCSVPPASESPGSSRSSSRDGATRRTIVRGRCLPYGEGITFWPIKSVISQAAGLNGEESPQAARTRSAPWSRPPTTPI